MDRREKPKRFTMNMKNLAAEIGIEEKEYRELAEIFVEETVFDLEKLESAVKKRDSKGIVEMAHSIKGAAANLRLTEISAFAQRMEMKARRNYLQGMGKDIQTVREALLRVKDPFPPYAPPIVRPGSGPQTQDVANLQRKKILVVDNHPVILTWMKNLLEKEGHQVFSAGDGLQALEILRSHRPDVIFTDLIMPRIGGEKLCRIIRRIPELKDVRLVVLSAVAAEQKMNLSSLGVDGSLVKRPFDEMAKDIMAFLNQRPPDFPATLPPETEGAEDLYPRQVTKELLSIKRHFEVILERMAEGVLEVTPEGIIFYANQTAKTLSGILELNLLGSDLLSLFHEEDRQRIKDLLAFPHAEPERIPEEAPVRMNGKEIAVTFLPIADGDNQSAIILLNDVSEKKRIQAQLLQAQKLEAIATFAGGLAHDFNNLLTTVQGYTSLMLMDLDPQHPHYENLRVVEKQAQSGARLVRQLLGYARRGKVEVKPINLNQLVEETSEAFGRTKKEITLHREPAEDLSPIEGDQGQMEQVVMNLLVNAADAMPRGGDLFLKTANVNHEDFSGKAYRPQAGKYVLLSVRDTGIGMDSKNAERIFEPFFTTKELGRGTGLGLASVYGIIKGHGGYIDVESEINRGTTFRIYLRASEKSVPVAVKAQEAVAKGYETVLLVDDEERILEVEQKLLRTLNYRVFSAGNGQEAVELYAKQRDQIDLVILDLLMPNMGGGEVFDRLKTIRSNVRVLLCSGYDCEEEAAGILNRGAGGFLPKPFEVQQLSLSIRTLLDRKDNAGDGTGGGSSHCPR